MQSSLSILLEKEKQARSIICDCKEALKISSTLGLARAFNDRAKQNTKAMWWWTFILFLSLLGAAAIGFFKVDSLNLKSDDDLLWINYISSLLSISGCVWMAWIATKHIGQRFKLSEDYHYKASVAKSYHGYREEAHKIDDNFAHRLFDTTLTRFEEPPLRLMDKDNFGSPLHEFFNSKVVSDLIKNNANFKFAVDHLYDKIPFINKIKKHGESKK